jgi:hypothetical protein
MTSHIYSLAAITQVVDGNWGVHAVITKSLFAGALA